MGVRQRGMRDERAGAKEIEGRGDVVAGLVPVIGEAKQRPVRDEDGREGEREDSPQRRIYFWRARKNRVSRSGHVLMDWAGRHGHGRPVRLECDGSEWLFVLCEVLPQHVPKRLGLLRTEIDPVVVLNKELVRRVLMGDAEVEKEVPDADADLHAVGIGLAIVRGFLELDFRLGMAGVHGAYKGIAKWKGETGGKDHRCRDVLQLFKLFTRKMVSSSAGRTRHDVRW